MLSAILALAIAGYGVREAIAIASCPSPWAILFALSLVEE